MSNRSEMIAAVKATGSHWFDRDTMAHWNSRVEPRDVIPVSRERGLWVFVSSERASDETFDTEAEARAFLGDELDGARVMREAPWWVVRFPRRFTVRTVNTGNGPNICVETPDSLNNDGERHATRDAAFAVAKEHAEAWHKMGGER